jgi:DNA-binding FadR family transcriptional regulator
MEEGASDKLVFVRENTLFHSIIAHASNNPVLHVLGDTLMDLAEVQLMVPDNPASTRARLATAAAHRRILEALVEGSSASAADRMLEHVLEADDYVRRKIGDPSTIPVRWTR